MSAIEFHVNTKLAVKTLVLGIVLALAAVLLILGGYKTFHRILGVLALPLAAYILYETFQAMRQPLSSCTVRFDERGIYCERWPARDVSWEQVRAIWVGQFGNQSFLALDLAPEVTPTGIRVTFGRIIRNLPAAKINFLDLKPGLEEAWRYLVAQQPQLLREPKQY